MTRILAGYLSILDKIKVTDTFLLKCPSPLFFLPFCQCTFKITDMPENRRHFRLREFMDVTWDVTGQEVSGEGTVVNISASGLLLQTDRVFKPSDECVLSIKSEAETLPFPPKKGKIMWIRRIHTPQERFQCGIQFLPDNTDNNFKQWFDMKVSRLSEAGDATILGNLAF